MENPTVAPGAYRLVAAVCPDRACESRVTELELVVEEAGAWTFRVVPLPERTGGAELRGGADDPRLPALAVALGLLS